MGMIEFKTSAVVITALNAHLKNDILNEFIKTGNIPVTAIDREEKIWQELDEKIKKENDVLHDIIYMIEYEKPFEA
jgi:hypothetical protein